jgi:RND superfamily putative drug exporter
MVIGGWIAVVALCGIVGLASGNPFAPTVVLAPGSESDRWYDLTNDAKYGVNVNVLLSGPRQEMRQQGQALADQLRDGSRIHVVSPFDDLPGGRATQEKSSLELLRPGSALILTNVPFRPGEEPADTLVPIRAAIRSTVKPPITSRITGMPALAEGISQETYSATRAAEMISVPLLMIVLLLIFRSPVAAAIPLIMGLGTTVAAGGMVKGLATQLAIDQVAVTMASMMSLALGVDYALLLVSRYREHRRVDPDAVHANIDAASRVAGRTIAFAAILLTLVMCAAGALAIGPIMSSAALGIGVATAFGALTAIFVAPALIKELDPWLNRWSVPWGRGGGERTSRLARRQPILIPLLALIALLAIALPTLGIETGAPGVELLPEGTTTRVDYEEIGKVIGPGTGAIFNVVVRGRDGQPLTTDRSLAAITRVQREIGADPGVDAVFGPAELNRVNSQLPAMKKGITSQGPGLARLDRGLSRAAAGSRSAGDGANSLRAASSEVGHGSVELAEGIHAAERGSADLAEGIGTVNNGGERLARGSGDVSTGAGKLSAQVEKARAGSATISHSAELLTNDLQTGSDQLVALHAPVKAVEANLASARRALDAMTTGRDDPRFQSALQATRAAGQALTGADPDSGEQLDPGYGGVAAGIADAEGQIDLGLYLANRLDKQGARTQRGVARLAAGARDLDKGAAKLSAANTRLSDGLARLEGSGAQLPEGLGRLSQGAGRLSGGIAQVEAGSDKLAAGIGGSGTPGQLTSGLDRMQNAVAKQRGGAQSSQLRENSPRLFESGMMSLAVLSGAKRAARDRTEFVLDLSGRGSTAQITAFPAFASTDPRIGALHERIAKIAHRIDRPELEVAVGGPGAMLEEYQHAATGRLPETIAAFVLISLLVLLFAVRAIPLAALCVALNLLTVGVTFGVMQIGFGSDDPLLGGPGYVDITGLSVTLAVVFALSIDYQVFLLARIREEYTASGSNDRALSAAIGSTAGVITGAAAVMVAIFLAFCVSSYIGIRQIGVGLAIAVFLDATVVRLVLLPAAMRLLGDGVWWFPDWLDRRLPNVSL